MAPVLEEVLRSLDTSVIDDAVLRAVRSYKYDSAASVDEVCHGFTVAYIQQLNPKLWWPLLPVEVEFIDEAIARYLRLATEDYEIGATHEERFAPEERPDNVASFKALARAPGGMERALDCFVLSMTVAWLDDFQNGVFAQYGIGDYGIRASLAHQVVTRYAAVVGTTDAALVESRLEECLRTLSYHVRGEPSTPLW
jgi:hypothetical protein